MSVEAVPNPILQPPEPWVPPAPGASWRWLHVAVGQEMFGRRAGPWGIVFAPVPLAALGIGLIAAVAPDAVLDPWLSGRLLELAWLGALPFLLAASGQALVMAVSDLLWRLREGKRHLDYSPRVWHYQLATALAALPLVLLQFSNTVLDLYLRVWVAFYGLWGGQMAPHAGYDPGLAHLFALAALPLVHWQVRRVIIKIPCGRMLGLQRELARLRGAVAWQPEAWGMAVGDAFDRWLADLSPPDLEQPLAGERQRQHRLRWSGLRKEIIASWRETPPDLPRANRALALYREGW